MSQTDDRQSIGEDAPAADRRSLVQSVSRAFDVLDVLRRNGRPMPPADVARTMNLDRTVVYRLLRTLAQRGMVTEETNGFALGAGTVLLGHGFLDNLPLRRIALPYMIDLQTKMLDGQPWTLALFIRVGGLSAVIERMWTPATPLGLVLEQGVTVPLGLTAAGRSILACLAEADAREILGDGHDELAPALDEIRTAGGIGLVDGTTTNGLPAVACAIRRPDGSPAGAIGVGGVELGAQLATDSALATQLRHAAESIGRVIQ
jgi:IclR family transcriptional regulator, acetate operon repressor